MDVSRTRFTCVITTENWDNNRTRCYLRTVCTRKTSRLGSLSAICSRVVGIIYNLLEWNEMSLFSFLSSKDHIASCCSIVYPCTISMAYLFLFLSVSRLVVQPLVSIIWDFTSNLAYHLLSTFGNHPLYILFSYRPFIRTLSKVLQYRILNKQVYILLLFQFCCYCWLYVFILFFFWVDISFHIVSFRPTYLCPQRQLLFFSRIFQTPYAVICSTGQLSALGLQGPDRVLSQTNGVHHWITAGTPLH